MKRNWRKGDNRPRKNRHKRERGSKRDNTVFPAFRWRTSEYRLTVKVAVAPLSPSPLLPRLLSASFNDKIQTAGSNVSDTVASVRRASSVVHNEVHVQ